MRRQLPDRVKMAAALLPMVADTSTPWILDACCKFVDPAMRRAAMDRGWHLVVGDIEPVDSEVVRMNFNERLPWSDGQFECVCCVDTLEHVENTDNAIHELARITREEGILIFGVPITGRFPDLRRETRHLNPGDEGHGHLWAFGTDVVERIKAAGFKIIGGVYSHDDTVFRLSHLWILERV